jgi:hypothetical protein
VAVTLEECHGVNDGYMLMLLSHAHSLMSLSVVGCDSVTADGFASVVCTRLKQLEIVRCGMVVPDSVMAASLHSSGCSLGALNMSYGHLGALRLDHFNFISVLIVDMCDGITSTTALAVVASCRMLRLLSAAGVPAFASHDVRLDSVQH